MWFNINQLLSSRACYRFSKRINPYLAILCLIVTAIGLYGGLVLAPADYQQGEVFRIIYIHVPAAFWSLAIYTVMVVTSLIFLVWKLKVTDAIAKVSASLGALFTALALVTGSIWGQPTWGTFWIWDARLTSELILLFIYLGIIILRSAMPEPQLAARASALMTLVGVVNLPIIHYSVDWWQTLHQGATLFKFAKPSMPWSMLWPLLTMIIAFGLYYLWTLLALLRSELLLRDKQTQWVREAILCQKLGKQ